MLATTRPGEVPPPSLTLPRRTGARIPPDCLDKDNNFGHGEEEEEVFSFDDREVFHSMVFPQTGPRSNGQTQREEHPAVVEQRINDTVKRMKEPKGILLERIRQQRRELDVQNPWPNMDRRYSDPQTQRL